MKEQRRGKQIAISALVLQTLVVVMLIILWRTTMSSTLLVGLWVPLGGLALAVMTALLFYVRQLESQERLEISAMEDSSREGIFSGQERLELRPAARRLELMTKWAIPIFTLILALYQSIMALVMAAHLKANPTVALVAEFAESSQLLDNAPAAGLFLILGAFASFLFSRYCTGLGSVDNFRPLRSVGSYFLLCSIYLLTMGAAMVFISQEVAAVERPVAWVLLAIQLVLGMEMILNLILEFYRPRRAGEVYAPAYESRVLNLIAEPQRLGSSISDTLNYQFGFEVSTTWFYKLIARAILPLMAFGIGLMLLLSSIVVVREGETFVIKHFGTIKETLAPGIHTKWPWPIDTAERYDTGSIEEILLGVEGEVESKKTASGNDLILWSEEHGIAQKKETNFLIAVPPRQATHSETTTRAKSPSNVAIIKLVVMLRYRILDPIQYSHLVTDPKALIKSIGQEEMVQYCARATLAEKIDDDDDRPQGIMTFGREKAANALRRRIEKRLGKEGLDLGVQIEMVKIVSAHPPASVVPDFEKVLEAERRQDLRRFEARGRASAILASVSGDPDEAMRVYLLLRRVQILETLSNARTRPADYAAQFRSAMTTLGSEIASLEKELARERLLGTRLEETKLKNGKPEVTNTHPQLRLQRAYQAFRTELQTQATPGAVTMDFATNIATLRAQAMDKISKLDGEPAALIAAAKSKGWASQTRSRIAVETMRQQYLCYAAAPDVYAFHLRMGVLDDVLPTMSKYVIGLDPKRVQIRQNLHRNRDALSQGLDDAVGE
ncbi:MAG: hypothetical protein HN909_05240 [Phycisphaerales bacterium]|jgi:modulator of FtsH protease HflK|nr:hypothetical protein [Phycisphaerales bacterium]MBT7171157.1 hypothetical protein [Phycisphaerales bacterium]